jgi:hypothetical protein
VSAPAQAAEDLVLCEGCERLLPRQLLCSLTSYCLECLTEVIEQDEASRRKVALAVLTADLRRIRGLDGDLIAEIIGIVRRAWS